jgi:hypothetical protein
VQDEPAGLAFFSSLEQVVLKEMKQNNHTYISITNMI